MDPNNRQKAHKHKRNLLFPRHKYHVSLEITLFFNSCLWVRSSEIEWGRPVNKECLQMVLRPIF